MLINKKISYWLVNYKSKLLKRALYIFILSILILKLYFPVKLLILLTILFFVLLGFYIFKCVFNYGFFHRICSFKSGGGTIELVDYVLPVNREISYRELKVIGTFGVHTRVPLRSNVDKIFFYDYCRLFIKLKFPKGVKKALVLGGGGCAVPKYLGETYLDIKVDVVEICPKMIEIAKKYFICDVVENIKFYNEDAEKFINSNSKIHKYEFVFNNLFMEDKSPEFSYSKHFLNNMKNLLSDDGILVANICMLSNNNIKQCIDNYKDVFENVFMFVDGTTLIILVEKSKEKSFSDILYDSHSEYAEELRKMWLLKY